MALFINPRKKPEGQGSTTPVTLVGSSNSVTLSGAVDTELTTADLDTGAGSDVHAVIGLLGSASGGGQIIPGSSTDGLLVNLGANNDVDTELSAAAALSDNFANPTAGGVGAFGMLWDGATWDRSPGNSTDGLLVNLGANNDVTITALPGDVEADIDQIRDQIDLITPDVEEIRVDSDAIRVAVEIMDDWDESDRAKVNPIAGQAGVQGGAGAVTALTQRIAIATDANTVDTELTTADLDTGAGTDTRAVVGLVFAASGGATLVSAAAPLPVTATATVAGSVDTELPDAAALADNTANPTTTSVGAFPHWWDGATWDRAPGTAADGLLVNLGTNNDVTVTGSVTANAGTNLNTSLLALEAGGNLAAAAASLSVVDDWDESDRAKVNPIAGQAGVQGGAGAVTALTQRVAIATDANAVKITDGTDTADVIDSGTFAGLGVYILDGAGDPITSFGGGTQYTEGDTDASITGTAAMWEDGSDTLRAISMAKPLPVQPGTSVAFPVTDNSGSLTVDGTVAVSSVGGTVAVTQSGTWDEVGINDSGNSITVDDGGTTISIDDGAGSITVDGTVAVSSVGGTVAVTQSGTWDEVGINDSGNSITVDNGGTFAVQVDGAALTALQLIDDVVYVDDTATHSTGTSKGVGIMAAAAPTDASVNANDIGMVAMTTDRKLHVSVQDAIPAGTNNIGDVDILSLPGDVEADIDQIRDQIDLITPDVEEIRVDADATRVAVEIMDDWDESDRAKVNPIVGQAGVQGGAGAVSANTVRVAIATDANAVAVSGTVTATPNTAGTATLTNVNDTASSTMLLDTTAGRKGAMIFNDSTSSLFVKFGTTASATSFTVKMLPGSYYELPGPQIYTGRIDGIWDADASGAARITELT